jgi:hypothetical protein
MLSGSLPVALWLQLTVSTLNSRVEDLVNQVKTLDNRVTSLQGSVFSQKAPGKF